MPNQLDLFAEMFVRTIRDNALEFYEEITNGRLAGPTHKNLQNLVSQQSDEVKTMFKGVLMESLDIAMHDFLTAVQESSSFPPSVAVEVDGLNLLDIADEDLNGYLFGDEGWVARFSAWTETMSFTAQYGTENWPRIFRKEYPKDDEKKR